MVKKDKLMVMVSSGDEHMFLWNGYPPYRISTFDPEGHEITRTFLHWDDIIKTHRALGILLENASEL